MDTTFQSLPLLSLCSGGLLGLERGIESVLPDSRTIAYVEIEAFLCENLVRQMEQGVLAPTPVFTNVKTFTKIAHHFCNRVHTITAGYPCQPFSLAGERKGIEDPRHLYPYIHSIVKAVRPVQCFFENVSGHLSMGFDEVYRSLSDLGYRVEAGIYTAEEIGAPHERERLFILAIDMEYTSSSVGQSNTERELGMEQNSLPVAGWHQGANIINSPGGKLGYSEYSGFQGRNDNRPQTEIIGSRCDSDKFSNSISNRSSPRLSESQQWKEGNTGITDNSCLQYPAPPPQQQYQWEAPRVESSLGFTINGYNYREDLLRMAGNGVVWQTAAKAYRELTTKMMFNENK